MKDVLLINGSPRGKLANSLVFLKDMEKHLDAEGFQTTIHSIGIRSDKPTPAYILTALSKADAVVFSFPLYAYTTPAAFTKFLEDYYGFRLEQAVSAEKKPKVYAFVNCAYAIPDINREALQVMRHFCRRTGMEWRFGVAAGGGLIVAMTRNVPIVNAKLRRAYKKIAADMGGEESNAPGADPGAENSTGLPERPADVYIKPVIPKAVMTRIKDSKWAKKYMAKKPNPLRS